jgi:hypothetical protein
MSQAPLVKIGPRRGVSRKLRVKPVEGGQAGLRPVGFTDRDSAVELRDRTVGETDQLVVPLDDLHPVGLVGHPGVGMQRRDGGLRLIFAEPVTRQRGLQHGDALGDQIGAPQSAVLVGQRHQAAVGAGPCVASGVVEQKQREQPGDLWVVGRREQLAGQPDRLRRQVDVSAVAFVEHQIEHLAHRA